MSISKKTTIIYKIISNNPYHQILLHTKLASNVLSTNSNASQFMNSGKYKPCIAVTHNTAAHNDKQLWRTRFVLYL